MRAAVGRADLVRVLANAPPEGVARSAALLGFDAADEDAVAAPVLSAPVVEMASVSVPPVASKAAPVPFWRTVEVTFPEAPEPPAAVELKAEMVDEHDLSKTEGSIFAVPRQRLLTPWSRLWPLLRGALQTMAPGSEVDVRALLRALGRGQTIRSIPRAQRRAWSGRASVWVDRSDRLVPLWSDQAEVCRRLRKVCGRSGFEERKLDGTKEAIGLLRRGDWLGGFVADPGCPVLVLGDLGTYGSDVERAAWKATARRLRHANVRVAALVPSPPARWDAETARLWSVMGWEQGRSRGHVVSGGEDGFWEARAERLLRLIAPAALVQPGLLRALRLLLPPALADVSTEIEVWNHAEVEVADGTGLLLRGEAADRLRRELAREPDEGLKQGVSAAIGLWHAGLPKELLHAEALAWAAVHGSSVAPPGGDLAGALAFAGQLVALLRGSRGGRPEVVAELKRYSRALLEGMPDAVYGLAPSLAVVWGLAHAGESGVTVPPGVDPKVLAALDEPNVEERRWWVRQVGSRVEMTVVEGDDPVGVRLAGSALGQVMAGRAEVWFRRGGEGKRTQIRLDRERSMGLGEGEALEIWTDREAMRVEGFVREPWAAAMGRDKYGLWADADILGVKQRFRWLPPGRFWMGSPEGEYGRYDWEGPQQLVTWTEGRWMADTPVTQALWEAVMRSNPSQFKSANRPVEQISWDDCQGFMARANEKVPGLLARLPTEAEWEYACRAGTETATWLGDMKILGENNAPLLDSIAWYSGNSGKDFHFTDGEDSSTWLNKQYDHKKAGTRVVRCKDANPWGLYDMLGNVLEWCEDWSDELMNPYEATPVIDPVPPAKGSLRVRRGGSWASGARYVRAAYRYASPPDNRNGHLGFRLARGLAPSRRGQRS